MARFLVERYVRGDVRQIAAEVERRSREATDALTAEGIAVAYLGSMVLPDDAACFCLYEADSALDVERANDRAGLSYLRITRALVDGRTPDLAGSHPAPPVAEASEVER